LTLILAVFAVDARWTLFLALFASVAGQTETFAVDVVAIGVVVTGTAQCAVDPPSAVRARIGAHLPRPSFGAETLAVNGVASTSVLTATKVSAILAVRLFRAGFIAQGSVPARLARTRSGDWITKGFITTLALL